MFQHDILDRMPRWYYRLKAFPCQTFNAKFPQTEIAALLSFHNAIVLCLLHHLIRENTTDQTGIVRFLRVLSVAMQKILDRFQTVLLLTLFPCLRYQIWLHWYNIFRETEEEHRRKKKLKANRRKENLPLTHDKNVFAKESFCRAFTQHILLFITKLIFLMSFLLVFITRAVENIGLIKAFSSRRQPNMLEISEN